MSVITPYIKNTVYQSLNDIALRAIAAVSGIIIIRFLSKEDYSLLALVMAIAGFANWVSNVGYPTMIIKSISQHYGSDIQKAASYYRFTFKIYGLISLVFSAALFLSAPMITKMYGLYSTTNLMRLAALLAFLMSLFSFYSFVFVGLNQFKSFSLKVCLPKELLTLLVIVVLLYMNLGVGGIITANVLGLGFAVIISAGIVSAWLKGSSDIDRKWIVSGAIEVAPANLAYASTIYMDIIIIGAVLAAPFLASYRACLVIVTMIIGLYPVGTFIVPAFNQLTNDRIPDILNDILKITLILSLPVMVFTATFSGEIVAVLFGQKYADSSQLLSLFSFVMMGCFLESIFVSTMTYLGRFRAMSKIWVIMAAVNIALLVIMTKLFGLTGGVMATIIMHYLLSLFMGLDINRSGITIKLRELGKLLFIGCPLFINLLWMRHLTLFYRISLFVITTVVYLALLQFKKVFSDISLLKEVYTRPAD